MLLAGIIGLAAARSPSHDPTLSGVFGTESSGFVTSPLPRPFAGLERIGKGATNVCRKGHGALPCRTSTRSWSSKHDRGRQLSPSAFLHHGTNSGNQKRQQRSRALSVRKTANTAMNTKLSPGEIVQEDIAWESPYGVLTVYERRIRVHDDDGGGNGSGGSGGGGGGGNSDDFPPLVGGLKKEGKVVRWHVVGSPLGNFSSVVVFPFDSRTKTCWLIREYCPGTHSIQSGVPGGLFEAHKHKDLLQAARDELNEEAGLMGGTWIALAPEGIPQDKYSRNRLHPYLVIDCTRDPNPRPKDEDEMIEVEPGVALEEAKRRVLEGDMPAPAAMVTLLAIDKLRQLGHI